MKIPILEMMELMKARPDWEWTFRLRDNIYKNRFTGSNLIVRIMFTCPCANQERLSVEQEVDEALVAQWREGYIEQCSHHLHLLMDFAIERHTAKWKRRTFFDSLMGSTDGNRMYLCHRCRGPLSPAYWERLPGRASSLLRPRDLEFYCIACGSKVQLEEDGKMAIPPGHTSKLR